MSTEVQVRPSEKLVTLEDVRQAQQRIAGVCVRTPLLALSRSAGELYVKPESLQPIGSFKLRGAYNKISSLSREERARGVITYSSGNHAQGVGYAARRLGARAIIVMPDNAPRVKVEATRALGAEIVFVGPASLERKQKAEQLAAENGYVVVPAFDDAGIIAGQGTIGLEILEDLPDVDCVLVPIGGGGLISGISSAIKLQKPRVNIIGVEPELAADAAESLQRGTLVSWPAEKVSRTMADGLRTQSVGELNFQHIAHFVDRIVTGSEEQIRAAMARLLREARLA